MLISFTFTVYLILPRPKSLSFLSCSLLSPLSFLHLCYIHAHTHILLSLIQLSVFLFSHIIFCPIPKQTYIYLLLPLHDPTSFYHPPPFPSLVSQIQGEGATGSQATVKFVSVSFFSLTQCFGIQGSQLIVFALFTPLTSRSKNPQNTFSRCFSTFKKDSPFSSRLLYTGYLIRTLDC